MNLKHLKILDPWKLSKTTKAMSKKLKGQKKRLPAAKDERI